MSTRRRIGVSAATTEAARRQLMQPVTCWEKQWVTPENASVDSTFKIYKWVKTDKVQQFNDDDGGVDDPLAPLPDEPEVVDVEDEEQDNAAETQPTQPPTEAPSRDPDPEQELNVDISKPPSPKPQLIMTTAEDNIGVDDNPDALVDTSLKPMDTNSDNVVENPLTGAASMQLDISGLGPDGLELEEAHELSQIEGADTLLGGPIMDNTMDPFSSEDTIIQ
ncbi:hypothetical protein E1B28_000869 [Marasmius oreades]|uniref:Uncharacterized protein n=1 Tax=Marasmius oreades TaxID=181124 RepID=A0A9P8AEY3_9AGAR|nr:uncharacterized protein E1B28_000869 [Marasmius oreades]KAG7098983.1 hypothetical protein E1B28_000869 [Marasmius oreades]